MPFHKDWACAIVALFAVAPISRTNAQHASTVADFSSYRIVKLDYGVNAARFGPAGTRGTVVLGWRENFNAHGFGVATFYLKPAQRGATSGNDPAAFGLVTLWDDTQGSKEALTVDTSGGADCVLHDFRLLVSKRKKSALLVVADRKMEKTYADKEGVAFKVYALKYNALQTPGRPRYYFEIQEQRAAERDYCDVETAFEDELGLGDYQTRRR